MASPQWIASEVGTEAALQRGAVGWGNAARVGQDQRLSARVDQFTLSLIGEMAKPKRGRAANDRSDQREECNPL